MRNGSTIQEIIKYFSERNIKNTSNSDFSKSSITRILSNKRYLGIYTYDDIEIKDGIPRIIDDATFEKVQKRLDKNKRNPASSKAEKEYLLTTKIVCGKCKEMMVGTCGTSKNKSVYNYYICKGKKNGTCDRPTIPKEEIEDQVIKYAKDALTDDYIDYIAEECMKELKKYNDNSIITRLEKELKKLEKEKKNLVDSLKECSNSELRNSIFEEFENIEKRKEVIEHDILQNSKNHVRISEEDIKFFLTRLKDGDINDETYRKVLITTLIEEVYILDESFIISFNVTGFRIKKNNKLRLPKCLDKEANGAPRDVFVAPIVSVDMTNLHHLHLENTKTLIRS